MGSCRTNIGQFLDKKYHFIDNYDLTHTTKEKEIEKIIDIIKNDNL